MSRWIVALGLSLFMVLTAVAAHAQGRSAPTVPPAAAPLTDSEKQGLEILNLKAQLTGALKQISDLKAAEGACHAALGPLQLEQNRKALDADQAALKASLEKARPGYAWEPSTGTFTRKPDAPKAPGGQ